MSARNDLAGFVQAAMMQKTMGELGKELGVSKNYVFRASLADTEKDEGRPYSGVMPENLCKLLDGLGLTFASNGHADGAIEVGVICEQIRRLDRDTATKEAMVAVLRALWIA